MPDEITYSSEQDGSLTTYYFDCSNCTGTWGIDEWTPSAVKMWCPFCGITARPDEN